MKEMKIMTVKEEEKKYDKRRNIKDRKRQQTMVL
jgi:hypothetical protein